MPHIHDKIDFTVEVFVVFGDKVLLRWHDKYDLWLSVGGHIELDEDPNQAALREVKEEVGLDVYLADDLLIQTGKREGYSELIPPKFLNRHRISDTHEHVCMTYFAIAQTDAITNKTDEISEALGWFSMESLDTLKLKPDVRAYAKRALEELGQ